MKQQPQVFSKEGAFGRSWGKLNGRAQSEAGASEKGLLVSHVKQDLNANILKSINNEEHADAQPVPAPTQRQKLALSIATKPAYIKTEVTATNLGPQAVLSVMCEHLSLIAEQHNASAGSLHVELPTQISGSARVTMTSSSHALILIPDADAIRLYVLPIELTRGAYNGPAFEPNCVLVMTEHEGTVQWQTKAGSPLTMAVMNALCHSLFQSLISLSARLAG